MYRTVYKMANGNSRDIILNTAVALFARKGYEGVGVQEICAAAGITKPTLYYFFRNKQGLLAAIADSWGAELAGRLEGVLVYRHDFIKGLTDSLCAELDFAAEHPDFFMLHCVLLNAPENAGCKSVYAPLAQKIQGLYTGFFMRSAAEFGNMRGKEELYALLYHNRVCSLAALRALGRMEFSDESIYRIVHSFVYGVAN